MSLSIKKVAEETGLTEYTLRYYEKEELLGSIRRDEAGRRVYDEKDMEIINTITCLKNTGMPIKEIRKFVKYTTMGDSTLEERRKMVLKQKKMVEEKIEELKKELNKISKKLDYYEAACKVGSSKNVKKKFYPENCDIW
ncbi:MerR family transcriptional regulator [Fusobacterium varium]|nr:MerR family transcriptional regulator [Fusobacterium varium]MCI6034152.1 MerR family transcriptional regulator [Fusobacterium varium]MDY4004373.1 MerR family transcriptional regulator [Fusobacterium varium]RGJ28762.1 MerR family transcriptional regulator [Fusobacterium varium]